MTQHSSGNLSNTERTVSALVGLSFSMAAMRGGNPLIRLLNGAVGVALLARSYSGRCAVKAALQRRSALPYESAIDTASDQSFPASDPPGSRLPDEPPSNAAAKWAAAAKAANP
jgi:hypothetical protein